MNRIRELREARGMYQSDLAAYLNVSQNTLSTWETGKHAPDVENMVRLASFFGVSLEYLLGVEIKKALTSSEDAELEEFLRNPENLEKLRELARLGPYAGKIALGVLSGLIESLKKSDTAPNGQGEGGAAPPPSRPTNMRD